MYEAPFCQSIAYFLGINPLPNKPWFLCACCTSHLLWVKEKLLIMNNFSFFHSVSYQFGDLKMLSTNSLNLEETKFVVSESFNIIIIVLKLFTGLQRNCIVSATHSYFCYNYHTIEIINLHLNCAGIKFKLT